MEDEWAKARCIWVRFNWPMNKGSMERWLSRSPKTRLYQVRISLVRGLGSIHHSHHTLHDRVDSETTVGSFTVRIDFVLIWALVVNCSPCTIQADKCQQLYREQPIYLAFILILTSPQGDEIYSGDGRSSKQHGDRNKRRFDHQHEECILCILGGYLRFADEPAFRASL